jgi:phosphate-selective porin
MHKKLLFFFLFFGSLTIAQNLEKMKMQWGGRIIFDAAFYPKKDTSFLGNYKNHLDFRQIRIYSKGKYSDKLNYKLQLGFIKRKLVYRDVYIEFNKINGIGNIRLGSYVNPYRLDVLNGALDMTFIERSFNDRLSPKWTFGMLMHNTLLSNGKLHYALSISNDAPEGFANNVEEKYHITFRLASLAQNNNKGFLLFDAAFNRNTNSENTWKFSSGMEFTMSERFFTIAREDSKYRNTFNVGGLYVKKTWNFQGEYTHVVSKNTVTNNNEHFYLAYGQIGKFITKHQKKFKNHLAPLGNVDLNGKGAVEVSYRYDYMSFPIANIREVNHSFGISWYHTKYSRFTLNYILANYNSKEIGHLLAFRTHIRF